MGVEPITDERLAELLEWANIAPYGYAGMVQALAARLSAAEAQGEAMRVALAEITEPIAALRRGAERNGATLNGVEAMRLSESAEYLKSIARRALEGAKKS